MIKIKLQILAVLMFTALSFSYAQTQEVSNSIDTLNTKIESIESDVKILKRLKFTGLLQAQWQKADTIGAPSFSGAEFKGYDNRFTVRRARLKAVYTGDNTNFVFQLDLRENGVFIKEAYGSYTEPFLRAFTLTGGVMNRPFGWEVEASSTSLEYPERARITQTLFPDECDLGAKLTIQAPKTSNWHFIKLDLGLYNGNAIAPETDNYKDFIGHLSIKKSLLNENMTLSGGLSHYNGGWANQSGKVYEFEKGLGYTLNTDYKTLDKVKRIYNGVDLQVSYSSALGLTTFRGEYVWGQQAGTKKSSISPKGLVTETKDVIVEDTLGKPYTVTTKAVGSDAYLRDFNGGYVSLVHRIMQSKHEVVVKYEWYDPNTNLVGNEVTGLNNTSSTDIGFTTLGLGWNYYITSFLRIAAYYEMVSNETANSAYNTNAKIKQTNGTNDFTKDLKDDIFTVRFTFKF